MNIDNQLTVLLKNILNNDNYLKQTLRFFKEDYEKQAMIEYLENNPDADVGDVFYNAFLCVSDRIATKKK